LQGKVLLPELNEMFCFGCPACTPPLDEMWQAWYTIVEAADPFLDTITTADLQKFHVLESDGQTIEFTAGSLMQRVLYHYWYHTGESMAIRQSLGHTNLPDFVGDIDTECIAY
jgi:hypothetical protein